MHSRLSRTCSRHSTPPALSLLALLVCAIVPGPAIAAPRQASEAMSWLRTVVEDHPLTAERPELGLVEPHVAVSPSDPSHLLVGTIVTAPDRSEGPWHCAALASFDGGRTWTRRDFDVQRCIDPWVLLAEDGTAWLGLIEIRDDAEGDRRFRLLVYRSDDGGRTWDEPLDLGRTFEHPTLAEGPDGELFVAGRRTRYLQEDRIRYAFDLLARGAGSGGFDERASVVASNLVNMPTRVVSPGSGVLVTTYIDGARWGDGPIDTLETRRVWALRSEDGGRSWSEPLYVGEACGAQGGFPGYPTLDLAPADSHRAGRLYHLCVAEDFEGLALTVSDDAGEHWSEPARIGRGAPEETAAYTAMQAVAPGGTLAVAWYDRSREQPEPGCQELVVRASVDGGDSFLPALALSTAPSCPDNPANGTIARAWGMGGDYDSLAVGPDGTFHAIWADARDGLFRLRHAAFRVDN